MNTNDYGSLQDKKSSSGFGAFTATGPFMAERRQRTRAHLVRVDTRKAAIQPAHIEQPPDNMVRLMIPRRMQTHRDRVIPPPTVIRRREANRRAMTRATAQMAVRRATARTIAIGEREPERGRRIL